MALDYSNANTGIFTHIGKLIKHSNLLATDMSNIDTDIDEVQDAFEAGDQTDKLAGFTSAMNGHKSQIISVRSSLQTIVTQRLLDRTSIVEELNLPRFNIRDVLAALITQMNIDSETINASSVTVGSVSADSSNVGDTTILIDKVLDGITNPGSKLRTHRRLAGVDSELSQSETMTVYCLRDSYSSNLPEGKERFQIHGEASNRPWDEPEGGSSIGPQLQTVHASTVLLNTDFESFTSNTPGSWTIDNGDAGTHILQETTEVYRGSSALEIAGDGSQATIGISQSPGSNKLKGLQKVLVCFRYKASATDTASQTLEVKFTGTGYTASSGEKVSIAGNAFSTSWSLQHVWVVLPEDLPSDFKLTLQVTGTLSSGKKIYIDDLCVAIPVWHNGLSFAAVAGQTPCAIGDKFTSVISNNAAGTFQEFFRRAYGQQLPSDTGGSETIADSLAS